MHLPVNKVCKVLGIAREEIQEYIRKGKINPDEHGNLDCEEVRKLYPTTFQKAMEKDLDYYEALKKTAGAWRDDRKEQAEKLEKHQLVMMIRRLEAEVYALNQRINELTNKE